MILITSVSAAAAGTLYKDPATGEVYADSAPDRVPIYRWNIEPWARFFLQHRTELDRDANATPTTRRPFNAFEATRAYVGLRGGLGDWGRAELVYDFRNQSGLEGYDATIKTAYIDLSPSFLEGNTVRFGQIALPWVGYEEGVWGYRVQSEVLANRLGYLDATDRGVGAKGTLASLLGLVPGVDPWASLRAFEYDVTFTNGEGWTTDEANSGKTWDARLTWAVPYVPGLRLSAASSWRQIDATHEWDRYIVHAAYTPAWQGGALTVGLGGLWTEDQERANVPAKDSNRASIPATRTGNVEFDGRGLSVYGRYVLPADPARRLVLFGRYDTFDPDDLTGDNSHDRWIGGLSFRPNNHLMFLVDYDATKFERNARTGTATAADRRMLLLQTQVDF